jgi:hypothetical protein
MEGSLKRPGERQLLGPHSQRARKSQGLRGTSVSDNIPLAFCLTDRPTISDESPIDSTVGASKPVPATARGRLDWLPTLKEGGQRNL